MKLEEIVRGEVFVIIPMVFAAVSMVITEQNANIKLS